MPILMLAALFVVLITGHRYYVPSPEPSMTGLFGFGLLACWLIRRRNGVKQARIVGTLSSPLPHVFLAALIVPLAASRPASAGTLTGARLDHQRAGTRSRQFKRRTC